MGVSLLRRLATSPMPSLAASDKAVLFALAAITDREGVCHSSVSQLSEVTGYDARVVKRARARLIAPGHLERVGTVHTGRRDRSMAAFRIVVKPDGCQP